MRTCLIHLGCNEYLSYAFHLASTSTFGTVPPLALRQRVCKASVTFKSWWLALRTHRSQRMSFICPPTSYSPESFRHNSSTNATLDDDPRTFPLGQALYVDATHEVVVLNGKMAHGKAWLSN